MKLLCNVVMLPNKKATDCLGLIKCIKDWESFITNEDSNIVGDLFFGKNTSKGVFEFWEPQHLYITSNESIKDEDWMLNTSTKEIRRCFSIDKGSRLVYTEFDKKIIATTDTSITDASPRKVYHGVGTIPESFVKAYIGARGNITIVLVEHVKYCGNTACLTNGCYEACNEDVIHLKLRPDNTIIISPSKTYTSNEVTKLLQDCAIHFGVTNIPEDDGTVLTKIDTWINIHI